MFSLCAIVSTVQEANSVLHREILRKISVKESLRQLAEGNVFMNTMATIYVGGRIHLMVVWIRSSVAVSTAAVASSRTSTCLTSLSDRYLKTRVTFDLLSRALARQMSCLCPRLKPAPPSDTLCSSPPDSSVT